MAMDLPMQQIVYLMLAVIIFNLVYDSFIRPFLPASFRKYKPWARDFFDITVQDLMFSASLYHSPRRQTICIMGDRDRGHKSRIGVVKGVIAANHYYVFKIRRRARSKIFACKKKYLRGDLYGPEIIIRGFGTDVYRGMWIFPTPPHDEISKDRKDNMDFIEKQVNQRGGIHEANVDRWETTISATHSRFESRRLIGGYLNEKFQRAPHYDESRIEDPGEEF